MSSRRLLISSPQVLELPPAEGNLLIEEDIEATFLDEFLIIVSTTERTPSPEFTIYDTTFPTTSRRFSVPQRYRDWPLTVFVDGDRGLGVLDRNRPLATDPAQAIFVVELIGHESRAFIIVRIQALTEHIRSVGSDACVPWDVWGGGAVIMGGCTPDDGYPLIHGTRVTILRGAITHVVDGDHCYLYIFDFSRRGWSILPLCDGGDGVERRAAFDDGQDLLFQVDNAEKWAVDTIDDGRFIYLVSRSRRWGTASSLTLG